MSCENFVTEKIVEVGKSECLSEDCEIMRKKSIPDRWLDYTATGKQVEGTRFITFKVPLKENCVRQNLPPKEWFTTKSLLCFFRDEGIKLGLVIDLTNTARYYNKNDFTSQSIKHEKILTKGHVVPSKDVCDRFKEIVNNFLNSTPEEDVLIGVHCTHGLNRTGYLVCRYMIDCMNIEPKTAIDAFNNARGHCMERENYLNALQDISSVDTNSASIASGSGSNQEEKETEHVHDTNPSDQGEQSEYSRKRFRRDWESRNNNSLTSRPYQCSDSKYRYQDYYSSDFYSSRPSQDVYRRHYQSYGSNNFYDQRSIYSNRYMNQMPNYPYRQSYRDFSYHTSHYQRRTRDKRY